MKLDTFINRPVLSTVISIFIVLLGLIGLSSLPVTQYPDIAPPTISVTTSYNGANAQAVLNSVIAPLEESINGAEGMTYIESTATNTGSATINVHFEQGFDPDMAAVDVQNRVSKALNLLPSEVTQVGVLTQKRQSSMLVGVSLYSDSPDYDGEFLDNYMKINVIPVLQRVQGVGDVMSFGGDYSMRIWIKPEVMAQYGLTPADVAESCKALVKAIDNSQIVMLPGGFSGGDEPDGSAKFIASFFRNPAVTEAVRDLLQHRDGLMLGICNGFQALIKLGLAAYGDIRPITACDPTLTFNTIGRHQSMLVRTRIASTGSPWLSKCSVGDQHTVAISHGEGRFVAPQSVLDTLIANGQIATQYVDQDGSPSMDMKYNPNGSVLAIEGITSPDGRVFGKMGHSERSGEYLYKNVTGDKYQPIFEGGVDYFKI